VKTLSKILKNRKLTLATAESCTGGNIAHLITSESGSSDYFKGGVVAYSNEVKHNLLGVPTKILEQYGSVSQDTVKLMAVNAMRMLDTDLAIATSGVAGPSGGTSDKPVGTVWIAVCDQNKVVSRKFLFGKLRAENITKASEAAFVMLLELLNDSVDTID
jgi:nicotinamide-nucleotide amidase